MPQRERERDRERETKKKVKKFIHFPGIKIYIYFLFLKNQRLFVKNEMLQVGSDEKQAVT